MWKKLPENFQPLLIKIPIRPPFLRFQITGFEAVKAAQRLELLHRSEAVSARMAVAAMSTALRSINECGAQYQLLSLDQR